MNSVGILRIFHAIPHRSMKETLHLSSGIDKSQEFILIESEEYFGNLKPTIINSKICSILRYRQFHTFFIYF